MKSKIFELRCDDEVHTFRLYEDGALEIDDFDLEEAEVLREMGYRQDCLRTLEDYQRRPLRFITVYTPFLFGDKLRLLLHGMIADYFYLIREAMPLNMVEHFSKMMNVVEANEQYQRTDLATAKNMTRTWTKRAREARWRREDKAMHPTGVVGLGPHPSEERRVQRICLAIIALYSRYPALDWCSPPATVISTWDDVDEIIDKVRTVDRDIAVDAVVDAGGGLGDIGDERESAVVEFNQGLFDEALTFIFEED